MNIQEFVKSTLCQIATGIEEAQNANNDSVINPKPCDIEALSTPRMIEFDIAVTVEKESETKGGIAVFGEAFTVGSQGASRGGDSTVSRIRFSVPVLFQYKASNPKTLREGQSQK